MIRQKRIMKWWSIAALTLIFMVSVIVAGIQLAHAQLPPFSINLLKNGDFNQVGPRGPRTMDRIQTGGGIGASAAEHWSLFANTGAGPLPKLCPDPYIKTELVPSTLIRGSKMLHVEIKGYKNGLVQVFGPQGTGPRNVIGCVWIYVKPHPTPAGRLVGIGIGDGGNTACSMYLGETGKWEVMRLNSAGTPANEIIIYSEGTQANEVPVEFFLESASVTTAPEIKPPRPYTLEEFNRLFSSLLKLCGPK
jgi:hypothetical protein